MPMGRSTRIYKAKRRGGVYRRKARRTNLKRRAAQQSVLMRRALYTNPVIAVGVSKFSSQGQTYSLNQVTSFNNMAAIYDQYRIVSITEKFINQADPSFYGTNIPLFASIVDPDDGTPIALLDSWFHDPRVKMAPLIKSHTRTFRPKLDSYVGNVSSAGIEDRSMWLDTTDYNAAYYGFKWAVINDGTTFNYHITRITTYTVEFRHPKSV